MKQKAVLKNMLAILLACMLLFVFMGCFGSTSYTFEKTTKNGDTFRGTFELDFSGSTPTYVYSGHDIDALCDLGNISAAMGIYGEIEKSGYLYDCGETRNGKSKYMPSGMDYYLWISEDESYITYGGYKFTK